MSEHSVIGLLPDQLATFDTAGNELTAPTYLPGYHVNMIAPVLPALAEYQVFPTEPLRVYGGAETVFLRFDDEAHWLAQARAAGVLAAEVPEA